MITIVMGRPGVGKSTYLAYMAKKSIKKNRKVYSNVEIQGTYRFVKEDLNKYLIENALVIIDEAGMEFNSRNFKSFTDNLYRFFTMHRHYNLDVILAVQFWDRLDIVIRELVHRIVVLRPTIFKYFSICYKEITCDIDISEENQIIEKFKWKPLSRRYRYKRNLFKMFDSFYKDNLEEKEFHLWGEQPSEEIKEIPIKNKKKIIQL